MLAIGLTAAAPAMNIVVTYPDPSVPMQAKNQIANIVAQYDSFFTNVDTVNITVQFAAGDLEKNLTSANPFSYSTWVSQLAADSKANPNNAELATAAASLPAMDPLLGDNPLVLLRTAYARAIGLNAPAPANVDGVITFSNSPNIFAYNSVPTPGLYDFGNLFQHNLNEVLGIGSQLTGLGNNAVRPNCQPGSSGPCYEAEDYFRFTAPHGRLANTDPLANVYFSPDDGVTNVARFNQDFNFGDRQDWIYGNSVCPAGPAIPPGPFVNDAVACVNTAITFSPSSPGFAVLLALGYDQNVPEPASVLLCAAGLALLAGVRRRIFNR
jgi:hypothetical protein